MVQARAIEQERIQSEIRRNNAEAKKMEAEIFHLSRSRLGNFTKYIISGFVSGVLLYAFTIDSVNTLYSIVSSKIKEEKEIREKNQKERVELEKSYLEMLIKNASINAFGAYVYLVKQKYIYCDSTGKKENSEKMAQSANSQACQLLHEYWKLVTKIAKIAKTNEELFLQMKKKIADELQEGDTCPKECRTVNDQSPSSPIKRKSLELIERHVREVHTDQEPSQLPNNFIRDFIEQPEFN